MSISLHPKGSNISSKGKGIRIRSTTGSDQPAGGGNPNAL